MRNLQLQLALIRRRATSCLLRRFVVCLKYGDDSIFSVTCYFVAERTGLFLNATVLPNNFLKENRRVEFVYGLHVISLRHVRSYKTRQMKTWDKIVSVTYMPRPFIAIYPITVFSYLSRTIFQKIISKCQLSSG